MSHFNHGADWVRKLLSDNQVGVILQFNSGLPFTLTSNRDLNQDGNNARPAARTSAATPTTSRRAGTWTRGCRASSRSAARAASRSWASSRTSSTSSRRRRIRNGVNVDTAGQRSVAARVRHHAVDADGAAGRQQRLPADRRLRAAQVPARVQVRVLDGVRAGSAMQTTPYSTTDRRRSRAGASRR